MENKINEYKARLFGSCNLYQPLSDTEKFVDLTIKNATLSGDQDLRDNQDGSKNKIYKIKITNESELTILHEQDIVKSKRKGSQSQKLRAILLELFNQQYAAEYDEFETFYQEQMLIIIKNITDRLLWKFLKSGAASQ